MKFVITIQKSAADSFHADGVTVLERENDPEDADLVHLIVESNADLRWTKLPGVIAVEPL